MRLRNLDLLITILVVALNVVWVQIPDRSAIVSIILALPLVLFLSGYAFTQILFRKKTANDASNQEAYQVPVAPQGARYSGSLRLGHPIGRADEIILSLGLSMAIDILVGFGLNILPIGLQALSWTFSLGFLTVLFALLALFLRRKNGGSTTKISRPPFKVLDILFLFLAAFIVGNSLWLAIVRPSGSQQSFTQFWMVPANPSAKSCAVSLGAQSFETNTTTYTLSLTVNGTPVANTIPPIALVPQQKWTQLLPITPEGQNDLHIEAQLHRTTQPYTYSVHLTFHVAMIDQNGRAQPQCTL